MSVLTNLKNEKEDLIQSTIGRMYYQVVKSKESPWQDYFIIDLYSQCQMSVQVLSALKWKVSYTRKLRNQVLHCSQFHIAVAFSNITIIRLHLLRMENFKSKIQQPLNDFQSLSIIQSFKYITSILLSLESLTNIHSIFFVS